MISATSLKIEVAVLKLSLGLVPFIFVILAPRTASADAYLQSPATVWEQVDKGALLLDVRTEEEINAGTLRGSLRIPHDEVTARKKELPLSTDQPILVYCASGRRSAKALQTLKTLGYKNVLNAGGFDELVAARPSVRCTPKADC